MGGAKDNDRKNEKGSNLNFSHQHRRRPVYQRSNTEPQLPDDNTSTSIHPEMKHFSSNNTGINSIPLGCDSAAPSHITSFPNKKVPDSLGVSSSYKNISGRSSNVIPTGCVYLRPEQNIPDVFFASRKATTFKPIVEVPKSGYDNRELRRETHSIEHNRSHIVQNDKLIDAKSKNNCSSDVQPITDNETSISRDDIVVTMRSVNV